MQYIHPISVARLTLPVNFLISLALVLFLLPLHTVSADSRIEYIQPKGLPDLTKYHLSQVVTSTRAKTVYISGQTARDKDGNLVGGDNLEKQMVQALSNIQTALMEIGASMRDVVRLEIYLVDWSSDKLPAYQAAMKQFFDPEHLPANTLLGIEKLSFPQFLVEITAIAVVDEK
ncbi:MAG: RidA family protein [Gammaproteobacteria bacterium]|nr:RidA family protein [Gammaproteobacteria bacterium]